MPKADSNSNNNVDIHTRNSRITNDLDLEDEEGPATSRQPIALDARRGSQSITSSPQAHRSIWKLIFKVIFAILSAVLTVLFVVYSVVFLIVAGYLGIGNNFQYGQAHAASTQVMINGTPTTIITSNINHTIYVTIISKDGPAKMYTGPALDASSWNGDPGSVVATASVGKGQAPTITVSLVGSVNYLRPLFVRPQSTFSLVPDKAGYKVVQS